MYFWLETVCVFDEEHGPGPKKNGMSISLREHPDADVSSIPGTKNIYKGCCWINANRHYKLKDAVPPTVRDSTKSSDSGKYLTFVILPIIGKEIIATK